MNYQQTLTYFRFFLWSFSHFKVPMIGYVRPRLVLLTEKNIVIKIRLTRRNKNHLQSMYFGALSVGADLAAGLHAFYHAKSAKMNASIAFKSFHANFLKRPESDVYFVCNMGDKVKDMVFESQQSGERINKLIEVNAYTDYPEQIENIARFSMELSIKVKNHD